MEWNKSDIDWTSDINWTYIVYWTYIGCHTLGHYQTIHYETDKWRWRWTNKCVIQCVRTIQSRQATTKKQAYISLIWLVAFLIDYCWNEILNPYCYGRGGDCHLVKWMKSYMGEKSQAWKSFLAYWTHGYLTSKPTDLLVKVGQFGNNQNLHLHRCREKISIKSDVDISRRN